MNKNNALVAHQAPELQIHYEILFLVLCFKINFQFKVEPREIFNVGNMISKEYKIDLEHSMHISTFSQGGMRAKALEDPPGTA